VVKGGRNDINELPGQALRRDAEVGGVLQSSTAVVPRTMLNRLTRGRGALSAFRSRAAAETLLPSILQMRSPLRKPALSDQLPGATAWTRKPVTSGSPTALRFASETRGSSNVIPSCEMLQAVLLNSHIEALCYIRGPEGLLIGLAEELK
jgi:hypothetical protein